MKLGIVGLPNVGKSTLFNSLTKAGALSANYPFATIDPNIGIVSVPDERIVKLGELYHTKKVTPATIEFVDIAGLVKGASKGEGLGNQFLANIREVDAIVHVVRCFEDTNIIHVDGSVDPARDIETINLELIFSDVEILDRRIAKIAKQARMDKTLAKELELVEAVKAHLEDGKMARTFEVPDDEDAQLWFKGYNLLTAKPTIYAANVSEDDLADDGASNPHVAKVREMAKEEGAEVFVICAQIEQELSELDEADHQMEMERIDLYKLAENCVQMMQVTAEKQGIRLILQGESTMVMANKGLMDEVFYNLCSNAIRYNKPGGSVTVTVGTKDERPFLSVADTGIGIPKECQERVFERFYRVDKSRSKSTGGTGLGLAIVKHIVAQHNAALHLDSELDEGTTIEIVF